MTKYVVTITRKIDSLYGDASIKAAVRLADGKLVGSTYCFTLWGAKRAAKRIIAKEVKRTANPEVLVEYAVDV